MNMDIELMFKSSFGENLSPRATNDRQSKYHHYKTTKLMDLVEKLSIEYELSPQRKNGSSVMHSEHGGIQLMDGGPIVTQWETLSIIGTSIAGMIALLKATTPIITQYMKEKYSGKIIIKKGKTQIEIHGESDINKAIDLLNRVEKKNRKE